MNNGTKDPTALRSRKEKDSEIGLNYDPERSGNNAPMFNSPKYESQNIVIHSEQGKVKANINDPSLASGNYKNDFQKNAQKLNMLYAQGQNAGGLGLNRQLPTDDDSQSDAEQSMEEQGLRRGSRNRTSQRCSKRAFRQYCERNQSQYVCCILTLYLTCLLMSLISFMILNNTTKKDMVEAQYITRMIVNNLYKRPIIDLDIVDSLPCQDGFDEIIFDKWPGTVDGCYCPSTKKFYDGCYGLSETGCQQVNDISFHKLDQWGNKHICVKRASEIIDILFEERPDSCPDGYVQCAFSQCFKGSSKSECPITDIAIKQGADSTAFKNYPYNTTHSFFTYKTLEQTPLFGISAGRNISKCFYPEPFPKDKYYPLINPHFVGEEDKKCPFKHTVDEKTHLEVLTDNSVNEKVFSLPEYNEMLKNQQVSLFQENRINITLSQKCRSNIRSKDMQSFQQLDLDSAELLSLFLFMSLGLIGIFAKFNKTTSKLVLYGYCPIALLGYYFCFKNENDELQRINSFFIQMFRYKCFINENVVQAAGTWFDLMSSAAILEIFVTIFCCCLCVLVALVYVVTKFNRRILRGERNRLH